MIAKIVRCRGFIDAVWDTTEYVDVYGMKQTLTSIKKPARKCQAEAKFLENADQPDCARPVCDDCANPFASLRYLDSAAIEKYGI